MATRVRPAVAADASFLAWVMLEASRGHVARGAWDIYVDAPEARIRALLERMAVQDVPSFCRWESFLVAEVDGTPAAALAAYAPTEPGRADPTAAIEAAARAVLGWDPAAMAAADARLAPFLTCVVAPPFDAWIVEWVATRPEFRRRGLVHALLMAAIDAGRRRGFAGSQMTLFIGNTAAEFAYARAGYAAADEQRHPDFARAVGCPGMMRMLRWL
jgi:GNAT superfamily N-acetyltransferase